MKRSRFISSILIVLIFPFVAEAGIRLPGLEAPVTVIRDSNGVPHIYADNEHDLFFMQGRIHAEDRLFQMDLLRRTAAATVAEVLGPLALPRDVEIRVLGLNRAADLSLKAHPQEMLDILQAYSDGVNSFIDEAEAAQQLPREYGTLGLSSVKRWEPLDSVLAGKALGAGTSLEVTDDIDLAVALGTYQAIGAAAGFDGNALFFEDLFRSAPFDSASTVPDAQQAILPATSQQRIHRKIEKFKSSTDEDVLEHGKSYLERIRKLRKIPGLMRIDDDDMGGSNSWVIGGQHTWTGKPLLANDMHLALESPTIFHELHLVAPGVEVSGSSLPGAPCVVRGHNRDIAWGITNARLDITDIYTELVEPHAGGLATVENGVREATVVVPEAFYANIDGTLMLMEERPVFTVPRRGGGPLITNLSPGPFPGTFTALSVQSIGFGPTRDPEGICGLNRATNLEEFKDALKLIDFASQHVTYADKEGNIGYFLSGELPLREDLQNPVGPITPPFMIRSGFGGNSWIPKTDLPEDQATPFEILPFEEMPQVVNPPSGFIVNANNDPVGNTLDNNPLNDLREGGNGLRYLSWGGRSFSIRAGRETEMIREKLSRNGSRFRQRNKISFWDMKAMQADTVLNDAKTLTPFILDAFDAAAESDAHPMLAGIAADPRVAEAVARLRAWDFTTPTGISQGYDARPHRNGVDASVAATIYSTWRGRMVTNSIDATLNGLGLAAGLPDVPKPGNREELVTALKHLLERNGLGVSGLNFFNLPGVSDPADRRDILILVSLADALDLLASDAFAPAFANSTDQDDYRWGKLHRIVIRHPVGDADPRYNIPPAFGMFPAPLEGLDGIPVDGGFETVDQAAPLDANNIRVMDSDSFRFDVAPTGRFVARPGRFGVRAVTSLPGGNSNVPESPFYINLLEPYFENKTFPMLVSPHAIKWNAVSKQRFLPSMQ